MGGWGQTEHGGVDLSVRWGCIWFLSFRGEGPAEAFYQGCGVAEATVRRVP